METEKIITKYFNLIKLINKEKQFNKKVDLNIEIQKYCKAYDITKFNQLNEDTHYISIKGKICAKLAPVYSDKKVNLTYKLLKHNLVFVTA